MKKNPITVLDVDVIGDQEQPITDIELKIIFVAPNFKNQASLNH